MNGVNPYTFFEKMKRINSFSDFQWFFNHQPIEAQIFIGALLFGCLALIWVFITAIFVDNDM
jgi:hypothetical protein